MSATTDNGGNWAVSLEDAEPVADSPPFSRLQLFLREQWQIVVGISVSLAGAVIVLLGWYGSAHTTVLQYQLPYLISGGMLGSAIIVLGGIYCFAHLLSRNQSRLEQLLFEAIYAADPPPPQSSTEWAAPTSSVSEAPVGKRAAKRGEAVWVSSGTSFHDASCQMVKGKATKTGTMTEARKAGLSACRICSPAP